MRTRGHRVGGRMRRRARRARRPRWMKALILGLILMGAGSFALLHRLWPGMPGIDLLWPVFPMFGGFVFLLSYLGGGLKDASLVFPGVAALGVGSFFLLMTVGPLDLRQLDQLWPVFPLIGGLAFFWTWVASFGRRMGLLVPAVLSGVVGAVALMFTLSSAGASLFLWGGPIVVFLGGLFLVLLVVLKQAFRWMKVANP